MEDAYLTARLIFLVTGSGGRSVRPAAALLSLEMQEPLGAHTASFQEDQ